MKRIILFSLFFSLTTNLFAQSREVKYVLGIETGTIFRSLKNPVGNGWNYSYGVNISYPIKRFSVSLGITHTKYGSNNYRDFIDESFEAGKENDFGYYDKEFQLNYIVLSNRIQFRLPCNCVFFHGGYNLEIMGWLSDRIVDKKLKTTDEKPYLIRDRLNLKSINISIEFGFGTKMHINDLLRIYMNPVYVISEMPSKEKNDFFKDKFHYLRMTFGIQIGIK